MYKNSLGKSSLRAVRSRFSLPHGGIVTIAFAGFHLSQAFHKGLSDRYIYRDLGVNKFAGDNTCKEYKYIYGD
jgi:hypothetical protein